MSEIKEKLESELKTVKSLCETIEHAVKTQVDRGLDKTDTHELGMAIDMLKDLSEVKKNVAKSMYYEQIMEAMEESEYGEDYDEEGPIERKFYDRYRYANGRFAPKGRGSRRGYRMTPEMYHKYPAEEYRDMDVTDGRMYYTETKGGYSDGYSDGDRDGYTRGYSEGKHSGVRDSKEGRSGMMRKSYMESKEMGKDKAESMKELEKYLNELSADMTEIVSKATPEEKTMLRNKINTLSAKIV